MKNREMRFIVAMLASVFLCGAVMADHTPDHSTGHTGKGKADPETGKQNVTDLAKKSQNPVSDLVTLQFQNNTFYEVGPKEKTQNVLLVQPVIPMSMNENMNFIARPIIPLIDQPAFTDIQNRNSGVGNIQFQGFFSPKKPVNGWILGLGPYFEFPTNSGPDGQFGPDNWSAGPAFVALKMKGPWVLGGLFTHLWSYHGDDPEVNLTGFQPIVNYNMKEGWYLNYSPVINYNWSADDSSDAWTVPLGGGVGRVFHVGKQAVNAKLAAYHMAERPTNGPEWQLQFQVSFLFPK